MVGVAAASASNGAATPFKVSIPGYSCSGARVVNSQVTKDSETCLAGAENALPPGNYTSSPCPLRPERGCIDFGIFGPGILTTWYSDYDYFVSPGGGVLWATSWTITIKANRDGSQTWTIEAIY
jgi:hypothetical protein